MKANQTNYPRLYYGHWSIDIVTDNATIKQFYYPVGIQGPYQSPKTIAVATKELARLRRGGTIK